VVAALALWASLPDVRPLAKAPPRSTAFIDLRREQAAAAKRRFVLRWQWRPLAQISPFLRAAVVMTEDARFWEHEGVDWDAVENAAEKNWEKRRFGIGGSTITQQVAKNLYLSPSKNPIRKLRELFIARRLEDALSKERVLEIYLNVAEWGNGVFGAEAAARHWFGTSAAALTAAQAARLALALPNPRRRAPAVASAGLDRRAAKLVRTLWKRRLLDDVAYEQALTDLRVDPPVPTSLPGD
ncbi:MAG TPA: monofunctional biosynthetic peptidoglycan transglycosylase, partial [Polyangia bacterium]